MRCRSYIIGGVLLFLAFIGGGCGYQLGTAKPTQMQGVKSLYLTMPDNRTQYPRLEAKLANNLSDAIIQDGVYTQSSFQDADAKLVTRITEVEYNQIRSSRTDGLRPEELRMEVLVEWEIISLSSSAVLLSGQRTASTRFYLEDNLQTAQQNAFPDALQRVSRMIVSSFSYAL